MSDWVFDASVSLKWFFPENYSAEARRWRTVPGAGHAPAFFEVEFANILWKKVRRAGGTRKEADDGLAPMPAVPPLPPPHGPPPVGAVAFAVPAPPAGFCRPLPCLPALPA